ncbi:MAG: HEPN domain-containing protein [Bacteroidales bacterium]|nr:HEPN domain-containing protein [Bacteroidales bacterium]
MSLTDEERRAVVAYRVEKARTAIEEIKRVMPMEVWGMIANRMYYAVYYAAVALLISDGHTASSHKGVLSQLNLHYVQTGRLTKEDGHLFGRVFSFRQESDYDDFIDASKEDVEKLLPRVEYLAEKIISLIR